MTYWIPLDPTAPALAVRVEEVLYLFRRDNTFRVSRHPGRDARTGQVALSGTVHHGSLALVAQGLVRVYAVERDRLCVDDIAPETLRRAAAHTFGSSAA